jgi:hypothetical protein
MSKWLHPTRDINTAIERSLLPDETIVRLVVASIQLRGEMRTEP